MIGQFKRLGKETLTYGFGGILSRFVGFILLPIYTRVFNPSDYGIIDIIATLTTLASIALTAGTESALSYYFFKYRDHGEQQQTITATSLYLFIINSLVALTVMFFAKPICSIAFGAGYYAVYLQIAIISLPPGIN